MKFLLASLFLLLFSLLSHAASLEKGAWEFSKYLRTAQKADVGDRQEIVQKAEADRLKELAQQEPRAGVQDELNTQLLRACAAGKVSEVNKLLEQGADIEVKDVQLEGTPSVFAVVYGHSTVAKILLKKGAKVEARTKDNWTPLLLACAAGKKDLVNLLLDQEADIDARLNDGRSAFDVALANKREDLVDLLMKKANKSRWAESTIIESAGTSDKCVEVRKDAEPRSPKVACLKAGEKVKLNGFWTDNDWFQVYEPVEGWVPAANMDATNLPTEKRLILSFRPPGDRSDQQRDKATQRPTSTRSEGTGEEAPADASQPPTRWRHGWH